MADERRRRTLGTETSAALPVLWALLEEREWSQAQLAANTGVDDGNVARILYGDRKASRVIAVRLMALGVAIELWDEPLPEGWLPPHAAADESGEHPAVPIPSQSDTG